MTANMGIYTSNSLLRTMTTDKELQIRFRHSVRDAKVGSEIIADLLAGDREAKRVGYKFPTGGVSFVPVLNEFWEVPYEDVD